MGKGKPSVERTPQPKRKLTGLIVAIIVIVVLVVLFGSACSCMCAVSRCIGSDGCMPVCGGIEWLPDHSDAWMETVPPQTAAPTAVPVPPQPEDTPDPVIFDGQTSLKTPVPQNDPAGWVRPKKVQLRNDGTDTVTVLVLMNGSDLETEYQEATKDLTEMVRAQKSDRVHIVVETVGTRRWSGKYGISSRRSERYLVTDSGLTLVDGTLGQLDTTVPSTLSDFIRWGAENYPADRYILLLWDHGGGPVYGFGYDEFQSFNSALTIDEMQIALRDGGVYFDLIGMDCCLMSSLEVCCALYEYCDYTLLSEDFEPDIGWSHEGWLTALAKDPAIATPALAKIAIDDSVRACETKYGKEDGLTLALIDESYMTLLYPAWVEFAYANENALLSQNYSQLRESTGRAHPRLSRSVGSWGTGSESYSLEDYCITDILSLAANIPSDRSDTLCAALDSAIVYYGATSGETTLAGLSVTLPYGDRAFYGELKRVFRNAGFDADYIEWLGKFVSVDTGGFFDFGGWSGWDDYTGGFDWSDWFDLFGTGRDYSEDWAGDFDLGDLLDWLLGNG